MPDTGESNHLVDSLLSLNISSYESIDSLKYYNNLINSYRYTNPRGAYKAFLRALRVHKNLKLQEEVGRTYNLIGNIFFDQGFFSTSVKYYKHCLDIAIENGSKGTVGYSYNDIGYAHRRTGNTEQALKNFRKAVEVLEGTDEQEVLAHTYSNMTMAYLEVSQFEEAHESIDRAIKIYQELGKERDYYRCLAYEASIYGFMGDVETGRDKMEKLIYGYSNTASPDSFLLTSFYRFMQGMYSDAGQYDKSLEAAAKGRQLARAINYRQEEVQLWMSTGAIYREIGDTAAAVNALLNGLEIAETYSLGEQHIYIVEELLEIGAYLSEEQLFKLYKDFHKLHHQYTEEVINEKLKNFDYQIEMSQLESQNELLEAEKKAYANLIFGVVGILLLIIILIVVILFFYKRRQKLNKELQEKNNELGKALDKQKELNDTKDKFFSIIAHDLKNPFGSFKQALEMLSENYGEFTDEERQAFLFELNKSSSNLKNLLEDLLTWSQSQRDTIPFNPTHTSLADIIRFTYDSLEPQAKLKEIELTSRGADRAYIYADVSMLSTILRNLVSNAIKYTPSGGRVTIYYDVVGGMDTITVKDTGLGMDEETRNSLFKVGHTKSKPGTSQESGTGLGLILTSEFIEKHKGKIRVESEVGKGSSFIISFPQHNNPNEEAGEDRREEIHNNIG